MNHLCVYVPCLFASHMYREGWVSLELIIAFIAMLFKEILIKRYSISAILDYRSCPPCWIVVGVRQNSVLSYVIIPLLVFTTRVSNLRHYHTAWLHGRGFEGVNTPSSQNAANHDSITLSFSVQFWDMMSPAVDCSQRMTWNVHVRPRFHTHVLW